MVTRIVVAAMISVTTTLYAGVVGAWSSSTSAPSPPLRWSTWGSNSNDDRLLVEGPVRSTLNKPARPCWRTLLAAATDTGVPSEDEKERRDGQPSPPTHPPTPWGITVQDPRRRRLMVGSSAVTGLWLTSVTTAFTNLPAHASTSAAQEQTPLPWQSRPDSADLPDGLLEARVTGNVLSQPPYGMEGDDIYYPTWFRGTWQVASTTTRVEAPCGPTLFGGNTTYHRALDEIGTTLKYASRFVPLSSVSHTSEDVVSASSVVTSCVADRDYNVRSLAKAAMGANSVIDVGLVQPNRFSCTLAPLGAPNWFTVDLLTMNRRQETISDSQFDCSEVVRELVRPATATTTTTTTSVANNGARSPSDAASPPSSPAALTAALVKEVETTSLYTYDKARDEISCVQRSASFLVPSQTDPIALQLWQASRGRPVDVRFYNVRYTRQQTT